MAKAETVMGKSPLDDSLPSWRSLFFTGLVLWLASAVVTALTGNLNMIPTVVLLGSFLVPATAVVWYLDHYRSPELTMAVVFRAFIVGGVLGVLAASLLESWLLSEGVLIYLGVGLIEEGAKLLALLFVSRHLTRYTVRDGIVLGATVGFGFAALESSGYALTALVVTQGSQAGLHRVLARHLVAGWPRLVDGHPGRRTVSGYPRRPLTYQRLGDRRLPVCVRAARPVGLYAGYRLRDHGDCCRPPDAGHRHGRRIAGDARRRPHRYLLWDRGRWLSDCVADRAGRAGIALAARVGAGSDLGAGQTWFRRSCKRP